MKSKKVYKFGGFIPTEGLTNGTELATGAVGALTSAFAKPNKYGRQSGLADGLQKGASFASMGAKVGGPVGAAIGGAVGLGAGLIGSVGAKNREDKLDIQSEHMAMNFSQAQGLNQLAARPDEYDGKSASQFFKFGGVIDGPGPKEKAMSPVDRSFWNGFVDHVDKKGYKGSAELDKRDTNLSRTLFDEYAGGKYKYDDFVPQVQQNISQYRNQAIEQVKAGKAQWPGYKNDDNFEGFMPGLSNQDGWAGSRTTSWKFPEEAQKGTGAPNTVYKKFENGGQMEPLAPGTVEVQGPSHEEGGVKLPNGAEVEGGETIAGNYVFSEELGFAKQHKPIAKAIGQLSKKPENELRKNTLHALQQREQDLALQQESVKQLLGL